MTIQTTLANHQIHFYRRAKNPICTARLLLSTPKGIPNITPIGSVFLKECQTGFFFDSYTSALANNLEQNDNVCVMAVNTNKLYWIKSFFKGRFLSEPGVRLYGKGRTIKTRNGRRTSPYRTTN